MYEWPAMSDAAPLRIGTLGAARITPMALVRPARRVPEAEVVAVAARDEGRARKFAAKHGIPRVHPSYEALLADPDVEAVYNPLPNGLHCEWTVRALEAGKHVLCEKPFASNADEAERMLRVARETGLHLVEAFHWRYHPLAARIREILRGGELGALRHVEAHLCIPLPLPGDIRYRLDLAGGAMMDVGSYTVNVVRFLTGAEPEVVRARARLSSPRVDRAMEADLRFPGGVTGRVVCSLFSARLFAASASARGERGELHVLNPFQPRLYHRLRVHRGDHTSVERVRGDTTYTYQLRAFVRHVRGGEPMETDGEDAVRNMRVIDAVYEKSGLGRRGEA